MVGINNSRGREGEPNGDRWPISSKRPPVGAQGSWHEGWDATPGMSEETRLVSGEVEEVAGALSSTKVH